MSLLSLKHAIISILVVVSCTLLTTFCETQVHANGGTKQSFEYRKLGCNVDGSGLTTLNTRSALSCTNVCSEYSSCWVAHYQKGNLSCKIDTRSVNVHAEDHSVTDASAWTSYLRFQYACETPWTQLDESCYHVSPNYYSWTDCLSYCQNNTSYLATIRNDQENDLAMSFIYTLPRSDKYLHIGGELNGQGSWVWVNREPWDFTRWDPLEPTNNSGEDCLTIFHIYAMLNWGQSQWNDVYRAALGYCLCEKSALVHFIETPTACIPEK